MGGRFDAFLSYARSSDDSEFLDSLVTSLSEAGFSIWFDRESLPNRGMTFDQEIRRAIESSARLLLIADTGSLRRTIGFDKAKVSPSPLPV